MGALTSGVQLAHSSSVRYIVPILSNIVQKVHQFACDLVAASFTSLVVSLKSIQDGQV